MPIIDGRIKKFWYTRTKEYFYLKKKKKEIMPFADNHANMHGLGGYHAERSQRKTNTVWYHTWNLKNKGD